MKEYEWIRPGIMVSIVSGRFAGLTATIDGYPKRSHINEKASINVIINEKASSRRVKLYCDRLKFVAAGTIDPNLAFKLRSNV